jgi:hypothetical protein
MMKSSFLEKITWSAPASEMSGALALPREGPAACCDHSVSENACKISTMHAHAPVFGAMEGALSREEREGTAG